MAFTPRSWSRCPPPLPLWRCHFALLCCAVSFSPLGRRSHPHRSVQTSPRTKAHPARQPTFSVAARSLSLFRFVFKAGQLLFCMLIRPGLSPLSQLSVPVSPRRRRRRRRHRHVGPGGLVPEHSAHHPLLVRRLHRGAAHRQAGPRQPRLPLPLARRFHQPLPDLAANNSNFLLPSGTWNRFSLLGEFVFPVSIFITFRNRGF